MSPKSAVYVPQRDEVVLTFDASGEIASTCSVYINQNVLCVGGDSPTEENTQGEVTLSSNCDIYGVSVNQLTFEQDGVSVLKPVLEEEFKVRVSVINTTKEAKECEVLLHLNGIATEPINKNDEKRVITIGAEDTASYEFTVTLDILGGAIIGRIYASVE